MNWENKTVFVGDLVISLIRRQISGRYTETRIIQEVLAIGKAGYPTHSCSVGNLTNEAPCTYNSKEFQHIVDYETLSEDEASVVKDFPQFELIGKPLDEPISHSPGMTRIEFIRLVAELRKEHKELNQESP